MNESAAEFERAVKELRAEVDQLEAKQEQERHDERVGEAHAHRAARGG